MNNKIGIVIPVFNNLFYTKQVLKSIAINYENTSLDIAVIVVDNGSTDGTVEYLKSEAFAKMTRIPMYSVFSETNRGYGGGANLGFVFLDLHHPGCDYLVMNNDMVIMENCIEELQKAAYSKDDVGIVGGKLFFPDGTIQHAGAFLGVYGWGVHKGGGVPEDQYFDVSEPAEQEYVTGALLYIKGEVVDKVGLFDERFERGYFEECDLSVRAREYGYKTLYCPTAKAIHYENITSKSMVGNEEDVKKQISDKNQIKFYLKQEESEVVESSNLHKLLLTTQIYGDWSFCSVMRNLAKGLSRNGVDVAIAPVEYHFDKLHMPDWEIQKMIKKPHDYWNRVVLRSSEGDHMYLMPPGKKRIAHTTGESTRISKDWVEQLNHVDQVITTSTFFRDVMLGGGVKTPIFVVPNSVNLELFKPEGNKVHIDGLRRLNLFSMFHFGSRKAPEVLIRAFCRAFSKDDDVTLTIHSLSMKQNLEKVGMSAPQWINSLVGTDNHAPILTTSNYIVDELVPALMRNFDVFVLPTRAEGFGLPLLEAGAMGLPSIVTNHSGHLDFINNDNGWLIDSELEDIPLQYLPYFQNYIGGKWANPSEDHLVELLRKVYTLNQEDIKLKGEKAKETARRYSIENIGRLAKEVIFEV